MCEKMATLQFQGELFENTYTEELTVCYSHECIWMESRTADSPQELDNSERYEFDFGSPEIAYASAMAVIEILEEAIPDIKQNARRVEKIRKY
jgi:hypothetical protein